MATDLQKRADDPANTIWTAAAAGETALVSVFLGRGVGTSERNMDRDTPLHFACEHGHLDTAVFLIQKGADSKARGFADTSPLHAAAQNGHDDIVKVLLDIPSSFPNARNRDNFTPLHCAVIEGHLRTVELLVEAGADTGIKTKSGKTALDFCKSDDIRRALSGERVTIEGSQPAGHFRLDAMKREEEEAAAKTAEMERRAAEERGRRSVESQGTTSARNDQPPS